METIINELFKLTNKKIHSADTGEYCFVVNKNDYYLETTVEVSYLLWYEKRPGLGSDEPMYKKYIEVMNCELFFENDFLVDLKEKMQLYLI